MALSGPATNALGIAIGSYTFAAEISAKMPDLSAANTFAAAATFATTITVTGNATFDGALDHNGTTVGFYGVAPATRPTAFTQTYATATKTHSNPTGVAVATTASTSTTPFGYAEAQANAIVASINAIIIDIVNIKGVLNSVIDDGQSLGLLQ